MTASLNTQKDENLQVNNVLRPVEPFNPKTSLHIVAPQGQVQVHTAPYRGSFSVVLSEAIRAAGLGSRVLVAQFLKGGVRQGPKNGIKLCGGLEWIRPAIVGSLIEQPNHKKENAQENETHIAITELWNTCKKRLAENVIDRIVLDEIGLASSMGYINETDLLTTLKHRSPSTDVILTGPSIPNPIIEMADQVTQLRCS